MTYWGLPSTRPCDLRATSVPSLPLEGEQVVQTIRGQRGLCSDRATQALRKHSGPLPWLGWGCLCAIISLHLLIPLLIHLSIHSSHLMHIFQGCLWPGPVPGRAEDAKVKVNSSCAWPRPQSAGRTRHRQSHCGETHAPSETSREAQRAPGPCSGRHQACLEQPTVGEGVGERWAPPGPCTEGLRGRGRGVEDQALPPCHTAVLCPCPWGS
nr:uncharacterized protein LOC107128210 [Macaca fascicularis]